MSDDLRFKLQKLTDSLDNYEVGQPLPIKIADIHFVIGACNQLLKNVNKLENSYKTDLKAASKDTDKFRKKWKESRGISTRLNNEIMSLKQVLNECKKMSGWRKSKRLKLLMKLYEASKKKFSNPTEPVPLPKVF